MELKYGLNPNQKSARIFMENEINCGILPFETINGKPGYINFMDALNGWQLVNELREATGRFSAASFKHVSPAGVGTSNTLAIAYKNARNIDPSSSYGDWIALSDTCDLETAEIIKNLVSDGIIAPDFNEDALKILKQKKKGSYPIIRINKNYTPPELEKRQIFGITFEQARNNIKINKDMFNNIVTENKILPDKAILDLIVALITLKYTQSNSIVYSFNGQAIGVGAGQQSRIACTILAGNKADEWSNRTKTKLEYISLGSDAYIPFSDNIERAHKSGVKYIAQPGGSIRDNEIIDICNKYGIIMCFTGVRLFHH